MKPLDIIQLCVGLAGLAALVVAAWRVDPTLGIAALGAALLLIDWRLDQ